MQIDDLLYEIGQLYIQLPADLRARYTHAVEQAEGRLVDLETRAQQIIQSMERALRQHERP